MRAISLWQPWASLIAFGAKCIETRSWPTSYRGPIAIHAAKRPMDAVAKSVWREAVGNMWVPRHAAAQSLPLGAIVATCNLVYCVEVPAHGRKYIHMTGQYQVPPPEPENLFGDYTPGRFAWLLGNIRPLRNPVPWRGSQGFFDVPDELLAASAPPPSPAVPAGREEDNTRE